MSSGNCPKCGAQNVELLPIQTGMRLRLSESGVDLSPPEAVCGTCYSAYMSEISEGARLIAAAHAKEQGKKTMWKTRVRLIREARDRVNKKAFSEAAVFYEKYLRVLEIVNNVPAGELDPLIYDTPQKEKELTIIASVYFDLMRIYDTSERYGDRQRKAAQKLASIVHLTPAHGSIMVRAKRFLKDAKNKETIRSFIDNAQTRGKYKRCFIASSAFGHPNATEVVVLRKFRDDKLSKVWCGKLFIETYYLVSPEIALFLDTHPRLKPLVRRALQAIALRLSK